MKSGGFFPLKGMSDATAISQPTGAGKTISPLDYLTDFLDAYRRLANRWTTYGEIARMYGTPLGSRIS
jgi:hypothetical protein